jgi:hypothetical protein
LNVGKKHFDFLTRVLFSGKSKWFPLLRREGVAHPWFRRT